MKVMGSCKDIAEEAVMLNGGKETIYIYTLRDRAIFHAHTRMIHFQRCLAVSHPYREVPEAVNKSAILLRWPRRRSPHTIKRLSDLHGTTLLPRTHSNTGVNLRPKMPIRRQGRPHAASQRRKFLLWLLRGVATITAIQAETRWVLRYV